MPKNGPRYKSIYETLKKEIFAKKYSEGNTLPTEVELMSRFSASRTTVRNALKLLHEEGLIISRRGVGTMVLPPESRADQNDFRQTDVTDVDFYIALEQPWEETHTDVVLDTLLADQTVAEKLEINVGTAVYRLRWLRILNDTPYNFLTHYLRMDLTPDLEKRISRFHALYHFVANEYGLHFTEAREEVYPICASFIEAHFLNVPEGKPLLKLCRAAYCDKGPLEYSESIINPDILKISMTIGSRFPQDSE